MATGAKTAINDNAWHTLTCVLTTTRVTMYIDGVERSHLNGTAGTIDNAIPMTVGGKINCDQVEVTCDYFSGQIDYVKITKSVNAKPTASVVPRVHRAGVRLRRLGVVRLGRHRRLRTPGTSVTAAPRRR